MASYRQAVGLSEKVAMVSFAMFLNAALYKQMFLESFSFPLDLTLFFLGLCVLSTSAITLRKGLKQYQGVAVVQILLFFFIVPAISLSAADLTREYPVYKATGFFTASLLSALIPIFMLRSEESLLWFLKVMFYITFVSVVVPVSIAVTSGALETETYRGDGFSANVIALSRAATFCILIALVQLRTNSLDINRILGLVVIIACVLSALTTASRGPMFGMIITFVLMSHKNTEGMSGLLKKLLVIGLLVVLAIILKPYIIDVIPEISIDKLQDTEASSRTLLWTDSWNIFLNNMEGVGFGGYNQASIEAQSMNLYYPHNIILEYLVEMGLFGGLLFVVGLALVVMNHRPKFFKSDLYTLVFVLLVYAFIQAQVSGSINGNRFLFLFIAIGLIKNNFMYQKTKRRRRLFRRA